MKLTDQITEGKTLFSFEILPPLKGSGIEAINQCIEPLMEFKPSFIDVTYHREEFKLRARKEGGYDRISVTKRPGTVAICAAILNKFQVEAVPHLICGGFSKQDTEIALIDLHFLGIDNVLALRGDNLKDERHFTPEKNGNQSSLELIGQIQNLNKGAYLEEDVKNASPTNFCIGAAGYPEKHAEAPNLQADLKFLKKKVDAGASFVTTQMFFDNAKYFHFVEECRKMGIMVPIIPGIKPITRRRQLSVLPSIFNTEIPVELTNEIDKAKTEDAVEQVGVEWCIAQCKELKQAGVPVLHFYTMGISKHTHAIASKLF